VAVLRAGERWVVTGGVMASRAAGTPAQAMALFARAVERMDGSLLRALMPAEERPFWSLARADGLLRHPDHRPALLELVQRLMGEGLPFPPSSSLEEAGVERGHVAGSRTVTMGDSAGQIVFVREPDGWKILDLRPHAHFLSPEAPAASPDR